ncbi:MAG TPA: IclR family transcriptional regulator [Streptosporangiaceae bacterium]|jgi:DNA-binding IclR family transcriptional regulator|nr:IclR family transcriptional regulator [Streptosporangiaceae bacterium]
MAHLKPEPEPRPAALIQSVDRAISLLELLAKHGRAGITEIADELGVHKSTASRLVSVLENRGLVEQLGERGKYALGFGIARLAAAGTRRLDLTKLSQPVCEVLARQLGETVNVAVLHDRAAINISQGFGPSAVAVQNWVGQRTPLHATSSGRVLLAHVAEAERDGLLDKPLRRYTPQTVTSLATLADELDRVRRDGYATSFEQLEVGLHAVAVPVFDSRGEVVAAIGASGPSFRLTKRRAEEIVPDLAGASAELTAQLGV